MDEIRGTVSIIYDKNPRQQESIARMRGMGWLVTVWNAPPGYKLPDPVDPDDEEDSNPDHAD